MEIETSLWYLLTLALIPLLYATIRFLRARRRGSASASHGRPRLPPGPWHLPVIGSLHHLIGALPHRALRDLSRRHGPLMLLRLGEVPLMVASSAEAAREVMKTHDQVLCTRPLTSCAAVLNQRGHGITFAPHGDRWRQLRKACVHALLNAKCVRSFRRIREEAAARFIRSIASSSFESQEAMNLSRMIAEYGADTTVHSVMGARFKEQDALLHYVDEAVRVVGCLTVSDLFPSWRLLRVLSGTLRRAAAFRDSSLAFMERFIGEHLERRTSLRLPVPEEDDDVIQVLLSIQRQGNLQFPISMDNVKLSSVIGICTKGYYYVKYLHCLLYHNTEPSTGPALLLFFSCTSLYLLAWSGSNKDTPGPPCISPAMYLADALSFLFRVLLYGQMYTSGCRGQPPVLVGPPAMISSKTIGLDMGRAP
ncbi:zealexin A1 synthase isoform X1 [Lolium perenne]|uniref:zealexin A1 synthase isoform X1 n=1 Tax=Lolium perenne TaxID=4522 RepID=UPI0021F6420E|nr:zealexin A1 synthase-like isoform X1 [Lolium perenne]